MSEQQPDINQHIAQHIRELRLAKGYRSISWRHEVELVAPVFP